MFKNQFFASAGQEDGEPRRKGRVYAAIEVPALDDGLQPYEAEPVYLEWAVSRSKCNTSCKVLPCLPNTTT